MATTETWLDKLLGKVIRAAGVDQTRRGAINFTGNVTVSDDPTNDQTTVIVGGGTTYNLDATSSALSAGSVVMLKASGGQNTITLAVPPIQGGTLGVALAPAAPGATGLTIAQDGSSLPNSVTGLGVSADGKAHDVTLTATGGLAYLYVPSGGEAIVGHSPGDGRLVVSQSASNFTSPFRTYTLEAFGAYGDNVHDDTPAWNALMAAIPLGNNIPARIDLGAKLYYMAGGADGKIHLNRQVHLHGRGGGATSLASAGFRFPPLGGLVIDGATTSSDGQTASFSRIEHVDVQAKTAIVMTASNGQGFYGLSVDYDKRTAGRYYEVGECVIRADATAVAGSLSGVGATPTQRGTGTHNDVMFRCTAHGTPTGAAPAAMTTADRTNIGNTITDTGGVTWKVESVAKDRANSTAYVVGERFTIPGDNRFVFEVTIAGTTGDNAAFLANVAYQTPQLGETYADGTATVKVLTPASFLCLAANVKVEHCNFYGGTGFALHCESQYYGPGSTKYMFADFCDARDCQIYYAGGGVHFHGQDANGGTTDRIRFYGTPQGQRTVTGGNAGDGTFAIWDLAQGLNQHSSAYSQFSWAPAFVNDAGHNVPGVLGTGGNESKFDGCNTENGLQSWVNAPGKIIGDASIRNAGSAKEWSSAGCFGITHRTKTGTQAVFTPAFDSGSAAHAMGEIAIGAHQGIGWYPDTVNGNPIGTGWLGLAEGPAVAQRPRVSFGVSYADAKNTGSGPGPGVGVARIYDGVLLGRDTVNGLYDGCDAAMLTHKSLRYGLRKVGDRFVVPSATHAPGTWRKVVVTTQGYRAPLWTNTTAYVGETDAEPYFIEATQVEQSTNPAVLSDGTGKVWRWMSGTAVNGGVEPTWPSISIGSTFTDADGNVWKYIGLTCVVAYDDFVDSPTTAITPQASTEWAGIVKAQVTQLKVTNDASAKVAATYALADNATTSVDVSVVMKQSAGTSSPDGAHFVLSGTWYRNAGGAPVQVEAPTVIRSAPNANGAAWTAVLALNGNSVEVHTTTDAAKTVTINVVRQGIEGVQL